MLKKFHCAHSAAVHTCTRSDGMLNRPIMCAIMGTEVLIYVQCFYMCIGFTPQETISQLYSGVNVCVCVFSVYSTCENLVNPKVSERVCAVSMKSSSLSPTWAGSKWVLESILYVIMKPDLTWLCFFSWGMKNFNRLLKTKTTKV